MSKQVYFKSATLQISKSIFILLADTKNKLFKMLWVFVCLFVFVFCFVVFCLFVVLLTFYYSTSQGIIISIYFPVSSVSSWCLKRNPQPGLWHYLSQLTRKAKPFKFTLQNTNSNKNRLHSVNLITYANESQTMEKIITKHRLKQIKTETNKTNKQKLFKNIRIFLKKCTYLQQCE